MKKKIGQLFRFFEIKWDKFINSKFINKIFLFLPHNFFIFLLLIVSIITIVRFGFYTANDYVFVTKQDILDDNIGPLNKKTKIDLNFLETKDNFSHICFKMGTYSRKSNLIITMTINNKSDTIYKATKSMKSVSDGQLLCYNINNLSINDLKENDVYLSPGKNVDDNNVVTIFRNSTTKNISAYLVRLQSKKLKTFLIITVILFSLIYFVINYLINTKKIKVEKYYFLMLVYLIPILFIIPSYQVPDEPSHFLTSYHLSQLKLKKYIIDNKLEVPENIDCLNYSDIQSANKVKNMDYIINCSVSKKNKVVLDKYTNIKAIFGYIPQAIGIKIADIFLNSPLFIFYFGRIFTFFISFTIVYVAIRITPKYKNLFLIVATMMMFIQQMVSYSYDSILNSVVLLFVSYILYLIYNDRLINVKDILILILLLIIINNIKNYVYLSLGLLILFIPKDKFWKKGLLYKYGLLIFVIVITVGFSFVFNSYANDVIKNTEIKELVEPKKDHNSQDQIRYLKNNPKNVIKIAINTLKIKGKFYLRGLVGYFGWFSFHISDIYIYVYMLLFLYIVLGENSNFKFNNKIIVMLSIMASIVLICAAMYVYWSDYKLPYVEGVQGRYFIPLLLPFMLVLIPKKSKYKINNNILYSCINILTLQYILTLILWFY